MHYLQLSVNCRGKWLRKNTFTFNAPSTSNLNIRLRHAKQDCVNKYEWGGKVDDNFDRRERHFLGCAKNVPRDFFARRTWFWSAAQSVWLIVNHFSGDKINHMRWTSCRYFWAEKNQLIMQRPLCLFQEAAAQQRYMSCAPPLPTFFLSWRHDEWSPVGSTENVARAGLTWGSHEMYYTRAGFYFHFQLACMSPWLGTGAWDLLGRMAAQRLPSSVMFHRCQPRWFIGCDSLMFDDLCRDTPGQKHSANDANETNGDFATLNHLLSNVESQDCPLWLKFAAPSSLSSVYDVNEDQGKAWICHFYTHRNLLRGWLALFGDLMLTAARNFWLV